MDVRTTPQPLGSYGSVTLGRWNTVVHDQVAPEPSTTTPQDSAPKTLETHHQRIESEQRRREELREGYRRLENTLPRSDQKSNKASLLDRAAIHIKYLEVTRSQLSMRLQHAEAETRCLRRVNEALCFTPPNDRSCSEAVTPRGP